MAATHNSEPKGNGLATCGGSLGELTVTPPVVSVKTVHTTWWAEMEAEAG